MDIKSRLDLTNDIIISDFFTDVFGSYEYFDLDGKYSYYISISGHEIADSVFNEYINIEDLSNFIQQTLVDKIKNERNNIYNEFSEINGDYLDGGSGDNDS